MVRTLRLEFEVDRDDDLKQFRTAFADLLRDTLLLYSSKLNGRSPETVVIPRVEEDIERSTWRIAGNRELIDVDAYVARFHSEREKLPSLARVLAEIAHSRPLSEALLVDAGGNQVALEHALSWLNWFPLQEFLRQYLRRSNTLNFEATIFEQVFEDLTSYVFELPSKPLVARVDFRRSVEIHTDPVALTHTVVLRPTTYAERLTDANDPTLIRDGWIDLPATVLEIRRPLHRHEQISEKGGVATGCRSDRPRRTAFAQALAESADSPRQSASSFR